jgi:hypothetical protein
MDLIALLVALVESMAAWAQWWELRPDREKKGR